MEFSSIQYFSFWSLISILFSTTGIYALYKATIPDSDMVTICFKAFFPLLVNCSISYAFLFRPALEHDDQELNEAPGNDIFLDFYRDFAAVYSPLISLAFSLAYFTNNWNSWPGICLLFSAVWYTREAVKSIISGFKYSHTIGNFLTGFAGPLRMYPYHTLCWVLLQGLSLLFSHVNTPIFLTLQLNLLTVSVSIPYSCFVFARHFKQSIATSPVAAYAYKHKRIIEIVCGMLATALAQYYFRVQTVALMFAFLCLACAWLGILANVHPYTDFGIFQFFVTTSLQCAVTLFGLHFYTFFVVLGGIVLTVLRWKMESVSLRHFGKQESIVKDWIVLEELYGKGRDSIIQTRHLTQPCDNDSITHRRENSETLDQEI